MEERNKGEANKQGKVTLVPLPFFFFFFEISLCIFSSKHFSVSFQSQLLQFGVGTLVLGADEHGTERARQLPPHVSAIPTSTYVEFLTPLRARPPFPPTPSSLSSRSEPQGFRTAPSSEIKNRREIVSEGQTGRQAAGPRLAYGYRVGQRSS